MADSTLNPTPAALVSTAVPSRPRRSPLHTRTGPDGTPVAGPGFAASLLPDDPSSVPAAERWTRAPAPATTHTERLVAGLAAVLAQMQAPAQRVTSTLRGRAFTGFAPGYAPAPGTASLRLPGFQHFWWLYMAGLAGGVG